MKLLKIRNIAIFSDYIFTSYFGLGSNNETPKTQTTFKFETLLIFLSLWNSIVMYYTLRYRTMTLHGQFWVGTLRFTFNSASGQYLSRLDMKSTNVEMFET